MTNTHHESVSSRPSSPPSEDRHRRRQVHGGWAYQVCHGWHTVDAQKAVAVCLGLASIQCGQGALHEANQVYTLPYWPFSHISDTLFHRCSASTVALLWSTWKPGR